MAQLPSVGGSSQLILCRTKGLKYQLPKALGPTGRMYLIFGPTSSFYSHMLTGYRHEVQNPHHMFNSTLVH